MKKHSNIRTRSQMKGDISLRQENGVGGLPIIPNRKGILMKQNTLKPLPARVINNPLPEMKLAQPVAKPAEATNKPVNILTSTEAVQPKSDKHIYMRTQTQYQPDGSYKIASVPYYTIDKKTRERVNLNPPGVTGTEYIKKR